MCNISISDFKSAEITGIKGILSFDEEYITLELDNKCIVIEGKDLKVDSLIKESGKICLNGEITSLQYKDSKQKKKKGSWL